MSESRLTPLFAAWILWLISGPTCAAADAPDGKQDSARQKSSSLDEQLLQGLDNALLDDLDTKPGPSKSGGNADKSSSPSPDAKPAQAKSAPRGDKANPLDDKLLEDLGGEDLGVSDGPRDPLVDIERQMKNAAARLADEKLDAQTRQLQQKILDDLAALVQECKKQCQGGGSGKSGSKPGRGSQGSQAGKSPATQAPTDAARESSDKLKNRAAERPERGALVNAMKASWGNLPERAREKLSNTNTDAFLPKYELMLEKYFKRLAESDASE